MSKTKLVLIIIGVLFIGYITTFGGCGGDGSGSGSSAPPIGTGPSVVTNPATDITQTTATLNGTANPNGVGIFVYFQFGTGTAYGSTTNYQNIGSGTSPINVSDNITGLSPNTTYNFRIMATTGSSTYNGENQTFTTAGPAPTCATNPATNVTYNSATLNGTVNPNGLATTAYFQWGTTTSYGTSTTSQAIGSGTSNVNVTANISGLSANTPYNFRVVGTSTSGTAYGNNVTFTTGNVLGSPPTVTTNPATNVTYNSATLNGTVIPNGIATNVYFNYGLITSYGNTTASQSIGSGITSVVVTAALSGLPSNTLYNFRVVAINSGGTANGNNLTFTTLAPPPTCTTDAATNIGTTTATLNGTVNPNGLNVTACYFDYGTSVSYGSQQNVSQTLPLTGASPVSVSANISSLIPGQQYNFRVVAANTGGTTNGNNLTFTTAPPQVGSPVPSNNATNVPTNQQLSWGAASGATSYDVYFGTTSPGASIGNQSGTTYIPTLTNGTTYYWRIDSVNAGGTTTGAVWSFTTESGIVPPTCTTQAATNIGATSAIGNGNITDLGGAANATVRGFYYGLTQADTWSVSENGSYGTGAYSLSITGLTASTGYYYRAFATNSAGNGYGSYVSFTTAAPPTAVDDYVWVANTVSNNVTRIQKSTSITTTIAVGTGPLGVAVDGTYCWVANSNSDNVTRIVKSTLATTTIAVGTYPWGVAVDATYCWVANYGSNNVTRITKATNATTTITAGSFPREVAVDGTYCWVTNAVSQNVTRILKSDLSTTTIAVITTPQGVAVDGTYCWVTISGNRLPNDPIYNVTRIVKSTLATTTITVGTSPSGVAVDETYCWASMYGQNIVYLIRKSDLQTFSLPVGINPSGVAVDGTYCWVANQGSANVTRITKATNATTTIAVGSYPNLLDAGYAFDNYSRVP